MVRLGRAGEDLAVRHLEKAGYRVRHRNWRSRRGEIDLVCEHEGVLVIVEVKTRRSRRFGLPEEAVDQRKILRLKALALEYMGREMGVEVPCRVDVVAIEVRGGSEPQVRHWRGVSPD